MTGPVWVDTHCHLTMIDDDPGAVLDRAVAADVAWVMCPGVDLESSRRSRAVADANRDRVLWSAGLHPHEANRWVLERDDIRRLAVDAAAIGECGLDYYRTLSPREDQLGAFRDQIGLGAELGKPIIVHCRDAFSDVHDVVEESGAGEQVVLHCWTGGPRWTRRFLELGVTFSFAGPLTYSTGDTVRRGAAEVPPGRAIVETDSPYLTPEPFRAQSNEPARVGITGAALAEVWGLDVAEAANLTSQRAASVFGVPP